MDATDEFEAERPRLLRLAARVLGDPVEAEDVVQQAWLRMHATEGPVASLSAWLTTVTTRLCLDRLRARVPVPASSASSAKVASPAAESPASDAPTSDAPAGKRSSDTLGEPPGERPGGARPTSSSSLRYSGHRSASWEVVDAFLAAAREGDLDRLIALLAPDARISADRAAVRVGTPTSIEGRDAVAAFFNGSARSALAVFVGDGPGAAWYRRGRAAVYFDFAVADGRVAGITFRADAAVLARVRRRRGAQFA